MDQRSTYVSCPMSIWTMVILTGVGKRTGVGSDSGREAPHVRTFTGTLARYGGGGGDPPPARGGPRGRPGGPRPRPPARRPPPPRPPRTHRPPRPRPPGLGAPPPAR